MPEPNSWTVAALEDLRYHWDAAYQILVDEGTWTAWRLDGGEEPLTAATPDELRTLIRADHARRGQRGGAQ